MKFKYSSDIKPFQADADNIMMEIKGDYNIEIIRGYYDAYAEEWYQEYYDGYSAFGFEEHIDESDIISWEYVDVKLNDK